MALTLNDLNALNGGNILDSMVFPPLSRYYFDSNHYKQKYQDDVLRSAIMMECGHFETIHDTLEGFNKELPIWSMARYGVWSDLAETTLQRYELINNYDRTEEWTETRTTSQKSENSRTGNTTGSVVDSGEDTRVVTASGEADNTSTTQGLREATESVSAHNVDTFHPRGKTSEESDVGVVGSDSFQNTSNDTLNTNRNSTHENSVEESGESNVSGSDSFTRSVRAYGNIGVTTTQQMLEEERKLALFSMVEFIVNDFKKHFCILVY